MSTGEEAVIERKARDYAENELGVVTNKMNLMGSRGNSDVIFWFPRTPLVIEFKAPSKEPTKLQYTLMAHKRQLGYIIEWVDNLEDAIEIIDRFNKFWPTHTHSYINNWRFLSEV